MKIAEYVLKDTSKMGTVFKIILKNEKEQKAVPLSIKRSR
jgi:hypothetical protein